MAKELKDMNINQLIRYQGRETCRPRRDIVLKELLKEWAIAKVKGLDEVIKNTGAGYARGTPKAWLKAKHNKEWLIHNFNLKESDLNAKDTRHY